MPKIDRHISDLLYNHDCVIVPDMGGFIASYSPAHIQLLSHTIEPPSKRIAFNVLLTHNDGLLASHIAKHEEINYSEAVKKINQYFDTYRVEIASGKKFVVERIGVLYLDAARRVQFEPFKNVNHLKDSFGLSTIHFIQAPPPLRPVRGIRSSIKPPAIKRKRLADALLVAGSIFWFCMNVYIVSPQKFDFASLNIFNRSDKNPNVEAPKTESKISNSSTVRIETVYVKTAEPIIRPLTSLPQPVTVNEMKNVQPSVEIKGHFHVIAGAFRSIDNATKLVNELKAQGFSNAGIVDSKNTLKKVSYDAFASLDEAQKELSRVKGLQKEGWIYHR